MIGGNQRRALPACPHVVGAHVVDDGEAGRLRQPRAVAELHGDRGLRAVQHGLAMEADDVGLAPILRRHVDQRLDGVGVAFGDRALPARQARPADPPA